MGDKYFFSGCNRTDTVTRKMEYNDSSFLFPDHCDQHRHNRDITRSQRRQHVSRRLHAQNDRESLIDQSQSSNVEVSTQGKKILLDF